MNPVRHVSQAETAPKVIMSVTGNEVIGILDVRALGPLANVDAPAPLARVALQGAPAQLAR